MKKIISMVLIILVLCPSIMADGMFHIYDRDMWYLHGENQQLAAINYQEGYENMLISVDINEDMSGEKAVWIFPVPSDPNKVVIDVLKGFPRVYGKDIDSQYNDAMKNTGLIIAGYSFFPFSIPYMFIGLTKVYSMTTAGIDSLEKNGGVTVYEKIEKMGLTTELITTKSQEALTEYLQKKGLDLPQNSRSMLDKYAGEDYSFVVSYISDLSEFKQEAEINKYSYSRYGERAGIPIGVFVKFPTDKIFFPLKPTSVYGSKEIPILLYVMGHVKPELYSEIKPLSEITYYTQNSFYPEQEMTTFFNGQNTVKDLKYTKIKITAPSKYFVDDLWIKNSAPLSVNLKSFFVSSIGIIGIILFIGLSMLASLFSGMISFRSNPLKKKTLLLNGLWNCLTFIGLTIATIVMKTKEIDPKIQQELKEKGIEVSVKDTRKILYVFLFYVFFVVLLIATILLLLAIL